MTVDLLIKNANVITLDSGLQKAEWVGVADGKIACLGMGQHPEAAAVADLNGATLLPGFCDSHVHSMTTVRGLSIVDLSKARSIPDVLDLLEEACKSSRFGDTIEAGNFSEFLLAERRFPTIDELDGISMGKKVVIHHQTLHGCVLNSRAFNESSLRAGMIGVEMTDGKANGNITDDVAYRAFLRDLYATRTDDELKRCMRLLSDHAKSKGISCLHTLDGTDDGGVMPQLLKHLGEAEIRLIPYWQTFNVDAAKAQGLPRVGGCLCLDGSRIIRTMALNEPYSDAPTTRGVLYYTDEKVYRFILEANERGMQCALHASGERAIDQCIHLFYKVIKESGDKKLRHRIEHFSMPTKRHIEMAVELGLILSMQPYFTAVWDNKPDSAYERLLGKERAKKLEPLNAIARAGGVICGGSDSPVTPINPILGINACVNNPDPDRNLDVTQALKIFTLNGAYACHEESARGSIEVGKCADFVVLDKDPYTHSKDIANIQVLASYVQGRCIYNSEN